MSDLLIDRQDGLLTLTLNRPERLNAFSEEMRTLLIEVLQNERSNPTARAILITGAGRGFCSGADLDPKAIFARIPLIERQIQDGINQLIMLMRDLPVPIIAAVNGPAAGAGLSLALAADIIIAGTSAQFAATFVRIGAVLDGGASYMLTHKIGAARATIMGLLGEFVDAKTALDWGLAYRVVEDDALLEHASTLGARLAAGPTTSYGLIKREIATAQTATLDEALLFEAASQARAFASEDFQEGVNAFAEKRKPVFQGH